MAIETIDIGPAGDLHDRLRFYFKDLVEQALAEQKFEPQPETGFYLVNLLARAVHTENIFFPKASYNGVEYDEIPIALQYMSSLELDKYKQSGIMKKIGDYSLFKIGFFPKSFRRAAVKMDYYMSMGSSAYSQLSWSRSDLFNELSQQFPLFCETLWIVSGNDRKKEQLLDQINTYAHFKPPEIFH